MKSSYSDEPKEKQRGANWKLELGNENTHGISGRSCNEPLPQETHQLSTNAPEDTIIKPLVSPFLVP